MGNLKFGLLSAGAALFAFVIVQGANMPDTGPSEASIVRAQQRAELDELCKQYFSDGKCRSWATVENLRKTMARNERLKREEDARIAGVWQDMQTGRNDHPLPCGDACVAANKGVAERRLYGSDFR
ncbi:phage tail protein X [Bradyrhizobium sp. AZCC 2262]|uniref:hypothetical protein n=1 Tax=Bradyrhizobium sp. AZCC 2262 TaxID=3117022 RepID=UPI002FF42A6C